MPDYGHGMRPPRRAASGPRRMLVVPRRPPGGRARRDVREGWLAIASEQKPIELILARNLLDSLHTPGCLIDLEGTLIYYNEAVAKLAGMSFEETGPMTAAQWGETFGPFDEAGRRSPFDEHPLTLA